MRRESFTTVPEWNTRHPLEGSPVSVTFCLLVMVIDMKLHYNQAWGLHVSQRFSLFYTRPMWPDFFCRCTRTHVLSLSGLRLAIWSLSSLSPGLGYRQYVAFSPSTLAHHIYSIRASAEVPSVLDSVCLCSAATAICHLGAVLHQACTCTSAGPGVAEGIWAANTQKLTRARFELAPPKRVRPERTALDHSATLPHDSSSHANTLCTWHEERVSCSDNIVSC